MRGFCGFISLNNKKEYNQGILKDMNNALHHRGPDDNGIKIINNVAMGHTRLSIIDLSVNGKQPMYSKKDDVVIMQ